MQYEIVSFTLLRSNQVRVQNEWGVNRRTDDVVSRRPEDDLEHPAIHWLTEGEQNFCRFLSFLQGKSHM